MYPKIIHLSVPVDLGDGYVVRSNFTAFADPWLEAERILPTWVLPEWADLHRAWNEWWECVGPVGEW